MINIYIFSDYAHVNEIAPLRQVLRYARQCPLFQWKETTEECPIITTASLV